MASYPRSGSTWLRFMLFQVLTGQDPSFNSIDVTIPEIDAHRGVRPLLPNGGRLIKTHERYRADYKRAIFLVRDVRDVLLSGYARATEVGLAELVSKGDLDSFLVSFMEGRALQWGSWQRHTSEWLDCPLSKTGNLLVVRYEDLRKTPEPIIAQLMEFVGVKPDMNVIRKAVEDNSLQQMREKEDRARKAGEQSVLLASHKSAGEDGRFVRKGSVGGWRSKLSDAQVKLIDQYAGDVLARLGYDLGLPSQRPQETSTITV